MKKLLLLLGALLAASPLHAQGWIEPPRPIRDFGVVKLRSAVAVRVEGRVARIEVEEWFQNRGGGLAEGDYLYPLPGEASFSDFSLFQGDRELKGETMDAERARAIYEEIVRKKLDPALIELAGHGLVRARVFPIGPGETRKITLRYTQLMPRAGDALQFRYAVGSRSAPGHMPMPMPMPRPMPLPVPVPIQDDDRSGPPRVPDNSPFSFTLITEDGAQFRDPFSPTHELRVTREGERLTVRPAGELHGDLTLFLPLARGVVGLTLATHRPSGDDGYFMLTLSPGEAGGVALPRDVTAVIDVSGSMSGEKLEQARQALRRLLGSLGREDRFRLIAFSSGVTTYRAEWTDATADELARARRWVDALRAEGGTNIADALAEAFRAASPDARLPIVVFLTDGLPSVSEQNPERIAEQAERARGRARVFAFGVGFDVNTYLLDRLSAAGRGTTEYIEPGESVESALGNLAAKIRHPVLTDLSIEHPPVRLTEIYPAPLPDLFAGEELVIFGRYEARDERGDNIVVLGRRNGRSERFATAAHFAVHETANDFIPRLWAARKIGVLTQQIRLNGSNAELVEEIRNLALRYGILTEYTSYLVQEPMDVAAGGVPRAIPMPMPAALAPSAQSGRAAVAAAEQSRVRRETKTLMQLDAAERADEALFAGPGAGGAARAGTLRPVAGRLFSLRDGVWTDARHTNALRVVHIEPFSPAYFELLRRAPELKAWLSQFDRVLVSGARVSIRVAPGGVRGVSPAELDRVVSAFRGL